MPAALSLWFAAVAGAQYTTHVQKPADKPTLRATAVLEWTGDLAKPAAARLVPIAVWDGEHYQPAALYLAQPAPLALLTGTQYELEKAGQPAGLFNVRGAATLGSGAWIGVGKYQPVPPPPPPPKLKVARRLPEPTPTTTSKSAAATGTASTAHPNESSDRPTLHRKTDEDSANPPASAPTSPSASPAAASTTDPNTDPDKPTLHRRSADPAGAPETTNSAGGQAPPAAAGSTPAAAPDPDKPTLHRKEDASTASSTSDDDPDRPTLHRRTDTAAAPPDIDPDRPTLHKAPPAQARGDAGTVSGTAAIDPDRPTLRRGKADAPDTALVPTKFEGSTLPIRRMVAVSDVKDVHSGDPDVYLYHWPSAEDEANMRSAMEALAVKALTAASAAAQAATFGPAAHPRTAAAARTRKRPTTTGAESLQALNDEVFATYELSFSSGPTVVLSARGGPAGDRYVTLIAQPDFYGQPRVLFRQVSSAATLDQTPRMQLVDAVDTDDDKQAELIFELIGAPGSNLSTAGPAAPAREYAIYRVSAAGAEEVFSTGPLP